MEWVDVVRDVRVVLFLLLFFYFSMRFGITTDMIVKPPLKKDGALKFVKNILVIINGRFWLAPFYFVVWLVICLWLLVDKLLYFMVATFIASCLFGA